MQRKKEKEGGGKEKFTMSNNRGNIFIQCLSTLLFITCFLFLFLLLGVFVFVGSINAHRWFETQLISIVYGITLVEKGKDSFSD